ncbi:hypothetical protein [Streptomyces shenzhenensis]|uniref:hypothetical protein n=1 Tax=Streptomyces shenzhenensis TaxID=943815 RepID=UPI0033FF2B79
MCTYVYSAAALLQLLWLAWLLGTRMRASGHTPNRRAAAIVSLAVLGALVLAGPVLQLHVMTYNAGLLLRTALLAWLACEVCLQHGIPLSRPAGTSKILVRWHTAFLQTTAVIQYCIYGAAPTFLAVLALRWVGPGWLPVMQTDQASALGASGRTDLLLVLPWTVVLEGVVIGTFGLLLHTAQRPTWLIYTIIAVIEIIFHAYFGAPAVLMGVYAVLCARFYLRYHRLGPLLLGHALFDLLAVLAYPLPFAYRLSLGLILGTAVTSADRWLRARTGLRPEPDRLERALRRALGRRHR